MKRHRAIPAALPPIEGYVDQNSRMTYLKQKMAAESRMDAFDAQPQEIREVAWATQSLVDAAHLVRRGVRKFKDAELAVARTGC
jgi:hypothetical protein